MLNTRALITYAKHTSKPLSSTYKQLVTIDTRSEADTRANITLGTQETLTLQHTSKTYRSTHEQTLTLDTRANSYSNT